MMDLLLAFAGFTEAVIVAVLPGLRVSALLLILTEVLAILLMTFTLHLAVTFLFAVHTGAVIVACLPALIPLPARCC